MVPNEIRKMRMNQLLLTNVMMLTMLILFFVLINVFTIRLSYFFFAMGVLILFQSIYDFIKGDSTKSFIHILEKISIYEKQKMGSEWYKSRRVNNGSSIVISGLMFFQFYLYLDFEDDIFQFEPIFMLLLTILILIIINISMLLHFRKVDHSTSQSDMKGYTWKSNLIGAVVGTICGLVIFIFIIYYVISIG